MFKLEYQKIISETSEYKLIETNYKSIKDNIEEIAFNWNENINLKNFFKLENCNNIKWFCLIDCASNNVVACQGTFENIDVIDNKQMLIADGSFLFSIGGNNYGIKLLKLIVEYYQKCKAKKFSFIVDPTAKISLFVHYYKHLNDGWIFDIDENKFWKSIRFTKYFY